MQQLYFQHHKMKVKQVPVLIYMPDAPVEPSGSVLRHRLGVARLNLGFALSHKPLLGKPRYRPYQAMVDILKGKGVDIK